jgi:hypothetical protein
MTPIARNGILVISVRFTSQSRNNRVVHCVVKNSSRWVYYGTGFADGQHLLLGSSAMKEIPTLLGLLSLSTSLRCEIPISTGKTPVRPSRITA